MWPEYEKYQAAHGRKRIADDAERANRYLPRTAAVVDSLIRVKSALLSRVLRPFPARTGDAGLQYSSAVMDRAETFSTAGGQLFVELRSAFYESEKRPLMKNYILGLGGRDTTTREITKVYSDLAAALEKGRVEELITHLDVRE